MKTLRLIISLFLIVGYTIGLTNNLMPRCESEFAHEQHIVSIHVNHFHGSTHHDHKIAHIGHEDHGDETSLINILQHLFDDIEEPKEKCEFGFFASIHNFSIDVKLPVITTLLNYPEFFIPLHNSSDDFIEYPAPNYSPPDQISQQQRGPPFILV
ncbi:MAG TPA: hypothetical protein VKX29_01660 [Brumimicrobium sp.]|nr:hypothetical protein [Brumimicrobium sp.]